MRKEIAPEVNPIHYHETFDEVWKSKGTLSVITEAAVTEIADGTVVYKKDSKEITVKADTVISASGTKPLTDKALAFYNNNNKANYYIIGDCDQGGTIITSMRSAYAAASQI